MQHILTLIYKINTFSGKLFAWSILILTFATSYEVFSRYLLGQPTTWAFDVAYMLYGALFMMAGAYTLARDGHVRGEVLYTFFPTRVQAGLDLVLYFVFFFPGILALCYAGYSFAAESWALNEHSTMSPAGPPIYHFKTLIPVAGVLIALQGFVEVVRCIQALRTGVWPAREKDVEEVEVKTLKQQVGAEQ